MKTCLPIIGQKASQIDVIDLYFGDVLSWNTMLRTIAPSSIFHGRVVNSFCDLC